MNIVFSWNNANNIIMFINMVGFSVLQSIKLYIAWTAHTGHFSGDSLPRPYLDGRKLDLRGFPIFVSATVIISVPII